ncbi:MULTISPECIES: alpha-ketoglutarate-dependent dioxygenase AlkB [unclassified Chelatococcus]|uniref:alpha-ketoglutarate-dependent dioxygenase AlkB family protein n=1 Tax=unclassified Chelatococcus TaxID=2638111 RepID=UPI001BD0C286|nr:alpha-ketoglutarate-dependent dioxygenase AlkB [Chelatococcus sp.]MBS7696390.1 alpha-ketoglutarate-dependent dioxygenase AlkB [Chelatococcus sp. YT9]MBX3557000.1 alpha-ketoglutarate-dependent dioxygenase AlkB [Chelatococcus sp.]
MTYHPGYLNAQEQGDLVAALRVILQEAPFFTPRMPRTGKPFSVRMSNCGALGWVSDARGYRYQPAHPETARPWPAMPEQLLEAWRDLAPASPRPEACLINFYGTGARMGLHQDRDEDDLVTPVVSLSLGDTAVFRIGGTNRRDPTTSLKLASGDALVFGGPARLAFHGIDRILVGSSTLLQEPPFAGGRINLTLRRVRATAEP